MRSWREEKCGRWRRCGENWACEPDGRPHGRCPTGPPAARSSVATRILDALARLADTGQGDVTRLQGVSDEWRLHVGDWRVRFRYATPPGR